MSNALTSEGASGGCLAAAGRPETTQREIFAANNERQRTSVNSSERQRNDRLTAALRELNISARLHDSFLCPPIGQRALYLFLLAVARWRSLTRPWVRQQSVHQKLERVIKHNRQQDQTESGARAKNQHRKRHTHR
jgi:hypothetical protein